MPIARSRVTAQGQISVPAEVRKKLGAGPGSFLEWDERNDEIIIRRAGRYSFSEIHAAVFSDRVPQSKTTNELKGGIRQLMRRRYARH
jgi:antitoxin PrlF